MGYSAAVANLLFIDVAQCAPLVVHTSYLVIADISCTRVPCASALHYTQQNCQPTDYIDILAPDEDAAAHATAGNTLLQSLCNS
jgi:hypothetical protein